MAAQREIDIPGLGARIEALPGFADVRAAATAAGVEAYIVGGAVRDALLGADRAELDVVTEGDHLALARALGADVRVHDRFATATVQTASGPVDVARARAESYPHPGALPDVRPATLIDDLGRRDFTVNSIAVSLAEPGRPVDPHEGIADLRAGLLRILHPGSFADDPTRALRAGRYATRFGFDLEPETRSRIAEADLTTVSDDRVDAELRKLALERGPRRGFELLDSWGVISLAPGGAELVAKLAELLTREPWSNLADPPTVLPRAALGRLGAAPALAALAPRSPSEAVEHARGHGAAELALARALGAEWLDRYVDEWRSVRPAVTGDDLLAAGVAEGPAVGRGLEAALRARLDDGIDDRNAQLQIALAAAGAGGEGG
jgi:tRNA nucleotidyltransferase (CCA-adding enzyme)